jgi:hypothetical protein
VSIPPGGPVPERPGLDDGSSSAVILQLQDELLRADDESCFQEDCCPGLFRPDDDGRSNFQFSKDGAVTQQYEAMVFVIAGQIRSFPARRIGSESE